MTTTDWSERTLGEVASRLTVRNRGTSANVLTISAKVGLVNQEKYFNKSVASRNLDNYFLLERGDFAYNKSHSTGYPLGVVRRLERYDSGVVSPLYICFRPNPDANVDPDFLLHFFAGGGFDNDLRQIAKQGARNHGLLNVKASEYFDMRACFPPLPEQERIAEILESVDEAIQATKAVIDQTRKVKQGLLQQLLTRGIGHTRFKQTEIGEIPDSWDLVPLIELVPPERPIAYGVLKPGPFVADGTPMLRIMDIRGGRVNLEGVHLISAELDHGFRRTRLVGGETVISLVGTIGLTARVPESLAGANLHRNLGRIAPGARLDSHYLACAMGSPCIREQIVRATKGGNQPLLNLGDVKQLLLPTPSLAEQRVLANKLEAVEDALESSSAEHRLLIRLKSGLISDLLSARVRVEVDA
ncbi:MAG: restriction endonuclease subunit S [Nannocystaceae bacterium]